MCERIYKQKFITLKELHQLSHHMYRSKSLNCSAAAVQCRVLRFLIVVLQWHKCIYNIYLEAAYEYLHVMSHLHIPGSYQTIHTHCECNKLLCWMQVVTKHHQGTVAAAVESIAIIGLVPPAAARGQPESEQVAGHK